MVSKFHLLKPDLPNFESKLFFHTQLITQKNHNTTFIILCPKVKVHEKLIESKGPNIEYLNDTINDASSYNQIVISKMVHGFLFIFLYRRYINVQSNLSNSRVLNCISPAPRTSVIYKIVYLS